MNCPACDAETVAFAVPEDLREYAAETTGDEASAAVAVCTNCLRVYAADDPDAPADFGGVSSALPADGDAALALLLATPLLDSIASNREAVEGLIDRVERAGVDPALAVERLAADPDLGPAVDLRRRYRQFEQLRG